MQLLSTHLYPIAIEAIKCIDINHLFALAVAEQKIDGRIFVDDTDHPTTFLVYHPYGMSLLFGDETNADFNAGLQSYALNDDNSRSKTEWLQAYPPAWNEKLAELFEHNIVPEEGVAGNDPHGKIELSTRVNFKFNKETYLCFKENFRFENHELVRTDQQLFNSIEGTVVPKYFWRNAADFDKHAVAFSVFYKGKPASTAFSAFVQGDKLELGIESHPEFRGKALAIHACVALIDYCLENGYEPVWACRLQNVNSYKLALKLGFEPTFLLPYYKLVSKKN